MRDKLEKDILNYFNISEERIIEFRKSCGFTFVFETKIISINERISSAEIRPVGIIYDENGQYYFAPLYDVKNLDDIIEKYVMEEECFHSLQ